MSAVKTYLLAPNFTFQPDGPIRLGNIIADPFKPTRTLSAFDPSLSIPETVTTNEFGYTISGDKGRSLRGSVWAQFLQSASAKVSGEASDDVLTCYTMDSLEAMYFKRDPTEEEVADRVKAKKVQAAMKAGLFGLQPVYMITGLRVAKGFKMSSEVVPKREGNVGASGPVTDQVSLGGEVGLSHWSAVQESFRSGNDIIFAYQLHVIAQKGWREKRVEVDVYAPKAAFLNDEKQEDKESIVASHATVADLCEIGAESEDVSIDVIEAQDGDETYVCVLFSKS
ncbi:MAG: hypothetical protein M1840_006815 [Geoglossum simile]|nr:MAG: hypothetical protein M1840_006815 [Geoglossum simile]